MATKLELIQQNRASGMSYLDAARAATSSVSSQSTPLITPGAGALQIAQAQTTAQNNQTATNNTQNDYNQSVQDAITYNKSQAAAGVAGVVQFDTNNTALNNTQVSTSTPGVLSSYSSPTAKQYSSPTVNTNQQGAANTQGNTSSITGGSFGAGSNGKQTTQQVVEGQTNKVVADTVANYDTNNTIDRTQYEQQKIAAEAKAMETDTELKRFQIEKEQLAAQEDSNQKAAAAQEAANMSALQNKERAANEASVAAAQAKSDAAERELQIANDIELQKSNVAFAKMGLTMSTAAVSSAQQIYTTGVYNLSKLKSENAFQLADLQVAVAKVEFDHTKVINDIINKSSEKSYEIRKKLNDDIHTIKNSIIDNRFERQTNIDKAIDTYQESIKANEDDILNKMNKANDVLTKNVDAFYGNLKKKEEYNTSKISTLVSSGKWYAMTPIARTTYEKGAGLPTGTVARQISAAIGTKIYTQAQEITGLKGVSFSSADYNAMLTEAQRLAELGVPLDTAINQVVTSYLDKSPEYQNALAKQRKDSTIKASGGGSSSQYGTSQSKEVYINGELKTVQYIPGTKGNPGKYVDNNGNPITGTIEDIGENTISTKTSTADMIRAAIAAKKTPTK